MDDKIIVSHKAALSAKYGSAGVAKVKAAVNALIAADAKRGLRSRLVYLDDAQAMKRCKGKAVTSASDERQVKLAIDAICRTLEPGVPDDPGLGGRGAAPGAEERGAR